MEISRGCLLMKNCGRAIRRGTAHWRLSRAYCFQNFQKKVQIPLIVEGVRKDWKILGKTTKKSARFHKETDIQLNLINQREMVHAYTSQRAKRRMKQAIAHWIIFSKSSTLPNNLQTRRSSIPGGNERQLPASSTLATAMYPPRLSHLTIKKVFNVLSFVAVETQIILMWNKIVLCKILFNLDKIM